MTASNRVDELRKRYHENPKRFFAPLANEYRKTGFIDRAILLCEKHLAEQPENMNGLVVYGQCLFESGRHADAHGPFEAALAVDPENLIALRHLGDIARLQGDQAAARGWYERVLEFDRRNEEVLELIEQVGGRKGREGREGREPSADAPMARSIISVASSVRVASPDALQLGNIELPGSDAAVAAPVAAPAAAITPAPASSTAPTVVRGAIRPRPPDSTAKTIEIPDPARPARRASILDIAFDFGEGDMQVAPEPLRAPDPAPAAVREIAPEPVAQIAPAPAEAAPEVSLIDLPPGRITLSGMTPVTGLVSDGFDVEIAALPDVEATEFQSGTAEPLAGLEVTGFEFDDGAPIIEGPSLGFTVAEAMREESSSIRPPFLPDESDDASFHSMGREEPSSVPLYATDDAADLSDDAALAATDEALPELPGGEADEPVEESAPLTETPASFVTETMATLYLQQGFRDRAIDVYRQLIEQDPRDVGLRERLEALETADRPSLGFEPPVEDPSAVEPDPPANAMLAAVSFAGVALVTPPEPVRASGAALVIPAPAVVASGPTARQFLRAFAHRSVTPALTPSVASGRAPAGALDGLFGPAVAADDERAAHRLAAVGATSGPSGGSAMDSLFGEGPSAPAPESMGRVSRASDRLNFEQFFTPPSAGAATPPAAPAAEHDTGETMPLAEDGAPEDDDLDQFQGWLRGLSE